MAETVPAPPVRSKARSVATTGYRKGEETRQRLLEVALEAFGDASYKVATTRRIAEAAGVSLPVLQYYFGGKEGLYRACAEAIVERFRSHTAASAGLAAEALRVGCSSEQARAHLKSVIGALAVFLMESGPTEHWA